MKKIIIYAMLLFVTANALGQQINPNQPLTRQDYLKKSMGQPSARIGSNAPQITQRNTV